MPRYAAFLRAVNLGPTNKASKEALKEAFESAGFEDVATFRTSGNVVFSCGRESEAKLTARIEKGLSDGLGFEIPVYLRSEKQLLAIAGASPFSAAELERTAGRIQVALLPKKPSAVTRKQVLALATDDDRLAFGDRELLWLPKAGLTDSELDTKAVAKLTGPQTVRTMGTIEAIAKKFFGA
jgi:uncharacterized protein (DUF1697 family)